MERGAGIKRIVPKKKKESWKDWLMEKSPKGMQIREIREMHEDECQGMSQDPGRMPRMGNWEQWQGRD